MCSGDELTLGRVANTNAAWLSRRFSDLGFDVTRHVAIPDHLAPLVAEIRAAARAADVVLLSGGLGPTVDDLTREAVARAARTALSRSAEALAAIRDFFRRRKRDMPMNNERQADIPRGASIIPNPVGTAPGFHLRLRRALVASLPGVPVELKAMFEATVVPLLEKRFPRRPAAAAKELQCLGIAESEVDRRLAGIATPGGNPRLSLMVHDAIVTARFVARGRTAAKAKWALEAAVRPARKALGDVVFGEDGADIGEAVAEILMRRKLTLSVAESCTGGHVGALLTAVPGISSALIEDVVTYANEAKEKRLGVPRAILTKHGAVSCECAAAMAEGSAKKSGADAALAVTGIAGPGGGSPDKPVGLVYTAVHFRRKTTVAELRVSGDRIAIQARAARLALNHLRRRLLALPP